MSARTQSALLFGASRGVGLALARRLRVRGDRVTALVRPGSHREDVDDLGVAIVEGDALHADDVERAFSRHGRVGLVVSTLGGRVPTGARVDDAGNRIVIDAAVRARPGRFVLVTSLGCGEMRASMSERALAAFGDALLAKTRAEEHLRATDLPWTIVRPGGLLDGPASGRGVLVEHPDVHGSIQREDVAALVVAVADDPGARGRTLVALDADRIRAGSPYAVWSPASTHPQAP